MRKESRVENRGYQVDSLFGKPPARRIKPSKCSNTGFHSSRKNGRGADSESALEDDFLSLLELDDDIERYDVQPVTIEWTSAGKQCKYTPDVLAKYTAAALAAKPWLKHTLYEVKPHEILKRDWKKFKPKFKMAVKWAKENGLRFKIITEKSIQTTALENAKFLNRFHCSKFPKTAYENDEENYVLRSLANTGEIPVKELLAYMSESRMRQAELIPWIWRLILEKKIGVDMNRPLTMAIQIWLIEGA